MTNDDKIKQDFEAWYNSTHREPIHPADRRTDGDYRLGISGLWQSYQAGREDERAEIAAKLESEDMVSLVAQALMADVLNGNPNPCDHARAALAAISKGMGV